MSRFAALCLSFCALSACAAPVWNRIEVFGIGISFLYPQKLAVKDAGNEIMLRGSGVTLYAEKKPYKNRSDGFGDWALSKNIATEVIQKQSCDPLKQKAILLPVKTDKHFQCHVRPFGSGAILSMIGHGQPFESLDFMQSTIIVLRNDDAIYLTYVTKFPVMEQTVASLRSGFHEKNPKLPDPVWPNRGFHFFAIDVRSAIESALNPPSPEVTANMALLNEIAASISVIEH